MNLNKTRKLSEKLRTRLEEILKFQKEKLKNVPEGSLRLSKSHGNLQFYHCTDENKKGKYISKDDQQLIRSLAQKTYDERILHLAEKRLKQIQKITKDYEENEIENSFNI